MDFVSVSKCENKWKNEWMWCRTTDGSRILEQGPKHFPFPTAVMHLQHKVGSSVEEEQWAKEILNDLLSDKLVRCLYLMIDMPEVLSTSSKTCQCYELCILDGLLALRPLWHSWNNSRMDPTGTTRGSRRGLLWRNKCSYMWQEQHPRNATRAGPFLESPNDVKLKVVWSQ